MINQLEENLEKFKPSEMWNAEYYTWLYEFLDEDQNRKVFFWVENDQLMITKASPPKFYGKSSSYSNSCYPSFFSKFKIWRINLE